MNLTVVWENGNYHCSLRITWHVGCPDRQQTKQLKEGAAGWLLLFYGHGKRSLAPSRNDMDQDNSICGG
ncbi:unnamed protein product [Sphenostylis stenocarpa]|uniref:Uncharacterized protein n=1 Tax=Sphenostylis stenocarpa TaxID=92480 RepID=A0AA86VZ79_9FABA|nr:unnamed protein product [Sphenostylis stenocarpa]